MAAPAGSSRTIQLDPHAGGYSFARLLFALLRQRFTGTVTLHQAAPVGARTLWMRGGMPVFTDWNCPDLVLGNILIERGDIDAAGLERGLMTLQSGGALLGKVLLDLELISPATRTEALREQCVRKLTLMFAADAFDSAQASAEVSVVEHGLGQGDELAPVNVLSVLSAGVTAHYDSPRVESELGAALTGDLVASPALGRYERQFGFVAADGPILAALGRGVTLDGLLRPGIERQRALQVIYTLWASKMLRVGDDAIQAIASGATAVAKGFQLGVNLDNVKPAAPQSAKPKPKPKAAQKPPPAPAPKAKPKPPPPPKAKPKSKPKPKPAAPPAKSSEDVAFEALLAGFETKISAEAHAFELFGLELDADRKQVRGVWAELSKTFHPDALEGLDRSHLRPRVEPVFAALSEAYGILGNKTAREDLRSTLEAGGSGKVGEDTQSLVRNAFEAEIKARDADKLLRGKRYADARDIYATAHGLSPQDSDIEAALHYSNFLAGDVGIDAQSTILKLQAVIEATPVCARAHYFKAMLHVRLGQTSMAKAGFAETQSLDPRNIDAQRQFRALKLKEREESKARKEKEDKGGFLNNLFGKK